MKSKLIASALIAAGLATASYAQTVSVGDLILGFSASSGTGATTNLEVDLGPSAAFLSAGPGTYTVISNLGTDLTSTYGAWNTDTALSWGIAGGKSGVPATNNTLNITGPVGGAYTNSNGSNFSGPDSKLGAITGNNTGAIGLAAGGDTVLTDITSQTAQLGAIENAITTATSNAASWSVQSGASAFGGIAPSGVTTASFEVTESASGGTTSADLFHLIGTAAAAGTAGVDAGTFAIDSSGNLTFTVIPEPSTYAAILGAISIGFVLLRRRKQALV